MITPTHPPTNTRPPPPLQVLVDLFVNYDCSLQAANLFERSIKCLRRLMALEYSGPAAAPYLPAVTQASAAACRQPESSCASRAG